MDKFHSSIISKMSHKSVPGNVSLTGPTTVHHQATRPSWWNIYGLCPSEHSQNTSGLWQAWKASNLIRLAEVHTKFWLFSLLTVKSKVMDLQHKGGSIKSHQVKKEVWTCTHNYQTEFLWCVDFLFIWCPCLAIFTAPSVGLCACYFHFHKSWRLCFKCFGCFSVEWCSQI